MTSMFLRASDTLQAKSALHHFETQRRVGAVLEVKSDQGKQLGFLLLEGDTSPQDPAGKIRNHGVSLEILNEDQINRIEEK